MNRTVCRHCGAQIRQVPVSKTEVEWRHRYPSPDGTVTYRSRCLAPTIAEPAE
jgi:hypothetical protein